MQWTIFLDESGLFDTNAPGLRVVGGVIVPRARTDAERAAKEWLEDGLREADAAWWATAVHANELLDPPKLAKRLARMAGAPGALGHAADDLSSCDSLAARARAVGTTAWRRLSDWGRKTVGRLRRSVGAALGHADAHVLVAVGHATWTSARSAKPETVAYGPVLDAASGHALLVCASRSESAPTATFVVATRWQRGATPSVASWAAAIAACQRTLAPRRVPVFEPIVAEPASAQAGHNSGLQVADLFVHMLGPRKRTRPLKPGEARSETRASLLHRLNDVFAKPDSVHIAGVGELCALVQGAVAEGGRGPSSDALRNLATEEPPAGNVRAAVDQAVLLCEELAGR